jgi:hypothetical protein
MANFDGHSQKNFLCDFFYAFAKIVQTSIFAQNVQSYKFFRDIFHVNLGFRENRQHFMSWIYLYFIFGTIFAIFIKINVCLLLLKFLRKFT